MVIKDKDIKENLKLELLLLQTDKDCYIIRRNKKTRIWDCFIYDLKECKETAARDEDLNPKEKINFNAEDKIVEFIRKI